MTSSNGNIFRVNWPFARGFHRSPVNSPHKGQWREALMFSLICSWTNGWVNIGEAGDLRHHRAHYDVTVIWHCQMTHIFNSHPHFRRTELLNNFYTIHDTKTVLVQQELHTISYETSILCSIFMSHNIDQNNYPQETELDTNPSLTLARTLTEVFGLGVGRTCYVDLTGGVPPAGVTFLAQFP